MTILLAVDVGNSQTKLGWFEQEHLREERHFPTGSIRPADAVAGFMPRRPTGDAGAAMCSVVPDLTDAWRQALSAALGFDPIVITGETSIGMVNHYEDPASLGPDRLVGALAARELYGAPVIAVSLGSATVVNAVSRAGGFLGGAIAPGVETSLAALSEKAARLLPVEFEEAPAAIATNTRDAMIAGAYFGAVGQVRELLAQVRKEMGEEAPAVITGGRATLVARRLDNIVAVEPALNLIGLRLAWEHVTASRR
jgi:type III pantothenate kinase